MGRVIRWLILLALITFGLLWPLVFSGGSAASDVADPVVFSNYKADFVVNSERPARRGRDDHRRISQRPPRHLPVLGRREPEQPPRAAEARDHLDPARRRAGVVPDAVGGRRTIPGGQDRRPGPVPQLWHPRLRAPLHHPRRARPRHHRSRQDFRRDDGSAPPTSPSVFFWNVIARSWNNRIERPTSR